MACRGVLPDGNQCDAADRHTDPATGLCGACGAPESKALVPVGSTGLMADPGLDVLCRELPPKAHEFLKAYVETLTIDEGSEVAGISRQSHYYWKKNVPGYREVFEVAQCEVKDRWRRIYSDKTKNGLTERMYDADGNLKHTRIREDAGLLKAQLIAVDPDTYSPDRSKNSDVIITIVQNQEWTDAGS